jgi:Lon protease-like protein
MAPTELLPLFPLPNVVLFPNVFLPLHVFEARYREMVADALAGDRLIGMVLLRPGYERDYDGRPPIYPVGCRGVMTHAERLPDGRFNIVLRGLDRFRIIGEDHERSYRRAAIEMIHEHALDPGERTRVKEQRSKIESLLAPIVEKGAIPGAEGHDTKLPTAMSDEDLIHALAQYLDLEPLEKQALLERPCLLTRARSLVELLEMRLMAARGPSSHFAH